MLRKINNQSGYILADAVIAVVIITVACVALIGTLNLSGTVIVGNDHLRNAVLLANNTATELKQYDGKGFKRDSDEWKIDKKSGIYTIKTHVLTDGTKEVTSEIADNPYIIPVRISVTWTESNTSRKYDIVSYYLSAPDFQKIEMNIQN